jgi:two-component system response regulator HydG
MPTRVLIVDDDPEIRWTVRSLLESRGYECEEAENGVAAVAQLASGFFDLVITDNLMPVMSGVELSEWLSEWLMEAPEGKVPAVIVLSGDLSKQERTRAMKAGVYSILSKPCDCNHLLFMVAQAVNSRGPHRSHNSPSH